MVDDVHDPILNDTMLSYRYDDRMLSCRDEDEEECTDRLSALPDILRQNIISLLPAKDARRTSYLSKRWRFMWCSSPSFAFNERDFDHRHGFIRFVNEALESRKKYFSDLTIDKFKVSMRFIDYEVKPCLERWIGFALERNVKELSIIAEMKELIHIAQFFHPFRMPFQLPKGVFTTKSIQYLELVFCDLNQVYGNSIHLPLLKTLDLINVRMNDSILGSLLSTSPILEKMNLSLVYGLEKIQISGEKLKMLVIFKCVPLIEVVVKAPNIESFLFRGKRQSLDKVDISSCQKLRFLWLQRTSNLTDDLLQKVIGQNQNLEIMILSHCSSLKNVVINSSNLWMLVLFKCKNLSLAQIDAPKLRAFEYSGHIISFPSMKSSSQLDAIIHMDGRERDDHSPWYVRLKEMCLRFDHCRRLWIRCENDVDLVVPYEMRNKLEPRLYGLRELKVNLRGGNVNLSRLEDGIRWIFPGLRNLCIESDGSSYHFEYAGIGEDVGSTCKKCMEFVEEGIGFRQGLWVKCCHEHMFL